MERGGRNVKGAYKENMKKNWCWAIMSLYHTNCMINYLACGVLCYVCNKRTYYTTEIHKIMTMQMNKKAEKNTV